MAWGTETTFCIHTTNGSCDITPNGTLSFHGHRPNMESCQSFPLTAPEDTPPSSHNLLSRRVNKSETGIPQEPQTPPPSPLLSHPINHLPFSWVSL